MTDPQEENGGMDLARIEGAVREILLAVGEDPDREGLVETPSRVARMYAEMFSGLHQDPRQHTKKFFEEKYDEVVLVRDISFCSMCEHHMLPFFGRVHVAYSPKGKIVGLSKTARLVEVFARRLQVQERLTDQIVQALWDIVEPEGAGVVVEAYHLCMMMRGVQKQNSKTITSAMRGTFLGDQKTRDEFLRLCMADSGSRA